MDIFEKLEAKAKELRNVGLDHLADLITSDVESLLESKSIAVLPIAEEVYDAVKNWGSPLSRVHKPCGAQVTTDDEYISEGYKYACLWCDEDLYEFETEKY